MKPLIVLIVVFIISLFITKITHGKYEFRLSARIALLAMLVFTAIGHFTFTKGMSMMVPEIVPFKIQIVYLTGVLEIIAAVSLLTPAFRVETAWFLIAFFILLLPANIYATIKHVDYQNATYDGSGLGYLWFRVPLQILFIAWTYFSAIKH